MTPENIMAIFPIGIYTNKLSSDFNDIINKLDNEEVVEENLDFIKETGLYSNNTYILNNPKYKKLTDFILKESIEYGQNILGIDSNEYKISQSWISHKPPNCKHHAHTHSNSIISGVIFYGEYDQKLPDLQFFRSYNYLDSNQGSMLRTNTNNIINDFTCFSISVQFKPNTLILFPSYLQHGVETNNTKVVRKSLSFNVIPKILGNKVDLNELKL